MSLNFTTLFSPFDTYVKEVLLSTVVKLYHKYRKKIILIIKTYWILKGPHLMHNYPAMGYKVTYFKDTFIIKKL